ncbi:MAG: DNRLRE domain-containing protein, partial [Verrucomicrobia bacterium]|nr:DNRLRE domain-containing protein [Verrucomicrobiota bacterium]
AQTTLTLQPDAGAGKDALIQERTTDLSVANGNFPNETSFEAVAWTWSGDPGAIRCLLQFDLSSIPSNAVITDARLSLYNNPASTECGGQSLSLSGSNAAVLQRITGTWNETTVTWNNQPATTNVNEVSLLQSVNPNQDYVNLDVTAMLSDMVQNPSSSFGFMIKLLNENYYRSMIFASSDYSDCTKHPKLEITYNVLNPIHVLTIKPDASTSQDALIQVRNSDPTIANLNVSTATSFEAVGWTWSGDPGIIRSLLNAADKVCR